MSARYKGHVSTLQNTKEPERSPPWLSNKWLEQAGFTNAEGVFLSVCFRRKERRSKTKISPSLWMSTFSSVTGFLALLVLLLLSFNNRSQDGEGAGSMGWSLIRAVFTTPWTSLQAQELSGTSEIFPFSFCMKLRWSAFSFKNMSGHIIDANTTVRTFTQNAENKVHRWSSIAKVSTQICFYHILCKHPAHWNS